MFALDYIDKADYVVMVEPDAQWIDALKLSFQDFSDKVMIIDSFLSDHDVSGKITVDTIVENYALTSDEAIVLKMDIEGCEEKALRGAKHFLKNKNAQVIACAYHHQTAAEDIKKILSEYGFDFCYSNGYMYFPKRYEAQLFPKRKYSYRNTTLRRGIIGARRRIE